MKYRSKLDMKIPKYKILLVIFDFIGFFISFFYAFRIKYYGKIDVFFADEYIIHSKFLLLIFFSFIGIFIFQYFSLYKKGVFINIVQQEVLILKSIFIIIILLIVISFFIKNPKYIVDSRLEIVYSCIFMFLIFSVCRVLIIRNLYLVLSKSIIKRRRVIIVGAGKSGKIVASNILLEKRYGFELVGFIDDQVEIGKEIFSCFINYGNISNICDITKRLLVDDIIISISNSTIQRLIEIINECKKTDCLIHVYSEMNEIVHKNIKLERFIDIPLVRINLISENNIFYVFIKKMTDVVMSIIVVSLFIPFIPLIALAIKMDSRGPIIFSQKRIGRNGREFNLYKFRTMYEDCNDIKHREYLTQLISGGRKAKDGGKSGIYKIVKDDRVTNIGRILRKTSIDEIPQFINVLKGEMSIIGPRPCLPYEYDQYDRWHKERLRVFPGITGLWQVSGRSEINFNDMVMLDIYYIENISPWFDLQILLKTIKVVFTIKGAY